MKRLPLIVSFLLFIALCASIAYWALQLFKPPLRPVTAPPRVATADVNTDAAAVLFGGRPGKVAVASNYQLKGLILSSNAGDSVAILSVDGKPAQAVGVGMEVAPGVSVKEVHREHVLLSEGNAIKRVELPESANLQVNIASAAPVAIPGIPGPPASGTPPARQVSPPPAPPQAGQTSGSSMPAQPTNPRSALFPPAAPQSQQPQVQQPSQAQTQTASTVPPTIVVSPPPSAQQATPSAAPVTPFTNAPAATAAPANPPGVAPTAPARSSSPPGELLPPPSLQSR